ncbi:MAG: TonB-dependent receptor [Acidobacteria bacterium]|nr:TonB-dependent receptor [Acidobacteriota bacterium]
MSINGLSTLSSSNGGIGNINNDNGINTYQDTLTWSKGKHVLKAGGDYRRFWQRSALISTQVYGNFNFNSSITGVGFSDFLLGLPFSSTRLDPLVARRNTNKQVGLFVTDTFKVTQKLTLDYGLRWDYYALPTYEDGLMYNWDPATGNVVVAQGALAKVHPLYPKTIKIVEGRVVPDADKRNFRPRISAAYRLTNKLVLRGGYGEYSEVWGYFSRLLGGGPFQLGETYNNVITNGQPLFSFPNPFPSSLGAATVPSQSSTGYPLQTDNGVIRQYSFTVEREFRDMGLRVSYIGSRGSGLNYSLDINKPPASTIPFTATRRPNPQFNGTTVTRTDGLWHYDSLQVQGQRRMGSFTFNAHWTWSNNMNNSSINEDPYNLGRWARDSVDRRHYVSLSSTWAVPVGKGRRYLSSAPRVVDKALGGWGLQYISYFGTGGYFSPSYSGSDPSNTNTVGGLPDRIADGNKPPDQRTKTQWFDPTAFKVPAPGHFGNSGVNILQGQGINVHHLSVAKTFAITERFKTTFTAAISNLFNHPHFNNPLSNITNPNPGQFTSIIPDYNPEKQSNRHIAMKLRVEW